jgi:hypothetical protein
MSELYGLVAEFDEPERLAAAARHLRRLGYRRVEAYSPYPLEELPEALGLGRTWIGLVVLLGGVLGGAAGYGLQYYVSVIAYPLNVGGRPLHSWPAFVPVTFEMAILGAALAAILGMLFMNGLPRPHHPLFNVPEFARASQDGFFLAVEATDPRFDLRKTRVVLQATGALIVREVKT